MRHLGIDYGQKKIGLAVSDPQGKIAFPLTTVYRKSNEQLFKQLREIISRENIQIIVVGLPLGLQGQETLSSRQAINFVQKLKKMTDIPVYTQQEELSTEEALGKLKKSGTSPKKMKQILDQQSAVEILQSFLNG